MTPVFPNHERVKQRIQLSLENFLGLVNICEVFTSVVAVCFQQNKDRYQYKPDIMVCCDENKFKIRVDKLNDRIEIIDWWISSQWEVMKTNSYSNTGIKQET